MPFLSLYEQKRQKYHILRYQQMITLSLCSKQEYAVWVKTMSICIIHCWTEYTNSFRQDLRYLIGKIEQKTTWPSEVFNTPSKKTLEESVLIIEWEILFYLFKQKWRRVSCYAQTTTKEVQQKRLKVNSSRTIKCNNKAVNNLQANLKEKEISFHFWIVWLWTVKWSLGTFLYWCSKTW